MNVDKIRLTNEVFGKLKSKCGNYKGIDGGGRGLCADPKNNGTIAQEQSCLRCGLPFCSLAPVVSKTVSKRMRKAEKERNLPIFLQMESAPCPKEQPAKVIDISNFVSPDALEYEQSTSVQ